MILVLKLLLAVLASSCRANLEGPFLFFGSETLKAYTRPALSFLDQDALMKIYGEQAAIVVFNNQDPMPLSSGLFPRLRKMLEGQTMLVLPQDFLDVHPDYISNETQSEWEKIEWSKTSVVVNADLRWQLATGPVAETRIGGQHTLWVISRGVLTLQGPWSERDAQMTETFARLQDIFGTGRVLGILGNSVSQHHPLDYGDSDWSRVRRQAEEPTTVSATTEDERPAKVLPKYALYNATGPAGKALLFSSGCPVLKFKNGTSLVLDTPVGQPTVKPTRLYTILVVRFADVDNTRDKITLEFSFKQGGGWWTAVGVEVKRGLETVGLNLQAPAPPDAPSAALGKSYHCSLELAYTSEDATLSLPDVKMQPYMNNTAQFSDSYDCIGFMTVPIWSGLMITFVMLITLALSVGMILEIKTMDRFETNRSKQLTITVSE